MIISIGDDEFEVEELLARTQADAVLLEQEIQLCTRRLICVKIGAKNGKERICHGALPSTNIEPGLSGFW